MTFVPEEARAPVSIGDISVVLTDYVGGEIDTVHYEVQVLQVDGDLFCLNGGDLAPHLTAGQITGLQDFMASVRTMAQGLLPS